MYRDLPEALYTLLTAVLGPLGSQISPKWTEGTNKGINVTT